MICIAFSSDYLKNSDPLVTTHVLKYKNKCCKVMLQVPVTDHNKLWTPTLTLVNVRGTERTRVDNEAVLTVHRRGLPLDDDLSTPEDSEYIFSTGFGMTPHRQRRSRKPSISRHVLRNCFHCLAVGKTVLKLCQTKMNFFGLCSSVVLIHYVRDLHSIARSENEEQAKDATASSWLRLLSWKHISACNAN